MATSEISPPFEQVIVDFEHEPGDSSFTIPVEAELESKEFDFISGELDEDPSYLEMKNSMRERTRKSSDTLNHWSILRVPSQLRELNEDAYTPRIVSIGPLHSGKEILQAMEAHKSRYMNSLFNRTTNHDLTFSICGKAILSMEKSACSDYDGAEQILVSNCRRLAEILLVDGCFLLELFLQWNFWVNSTEISGDPLFGASTICSLQRDLALLENQIPFKVLERLFELIMARIPDRHAQYEYPLSLKQLCASFFYLELNLSQSTTTDYRHLLDLIRNCYMPRKNAEILQVGVGTELKLIRIPSRQPNAIPCNFCMMLAPRPPGLINKALCKFCSMLTPRAKQKPQKKRWELIHCVTKLRESGIKFEKGTSENLFDIKFSSKMGLGVLEIPKLFIDDTMDSLMRNMIALEQCCHWTSYHITSYAVLMDCLIDSPADAEFLQHRRIIENYLGHGEEVSNIFNKISKKVFVEDFYFDTLCKQVNEYSDKCWPMKREIFVRDYWFSPWKFIGVVAGSMLLLFAAFQTGYTIATYYVHHN